MDRPDEAKRVIRSVFETLRHRIAALARLPIESLDKRVSQGKLREIGSPA
jgi:hypothetical protein